MENLFYNDKAVIITKKSNLFYVSKYNNEDAKIVFYQNKKYYFTDSRYFEEVGEILTDYIILDITKFYDFFENNNINSVAVEDDITFVEYNRLVNAGIKNIDIEILTKSLTLLRQVKTENEIDILVKAQAITDKTFSEILPHIKYGVSEIELKNELESLLLKNGAEEMAFSSIVAFGENTSKPHAHASNKRLEKNTFITMDFGAKSCGYCSDMTRTIYFGKPNQEEIDFYNLVLEAQLIALENIKAGYTGKEIDSFARNIFKEKNFDKYFLHSLGHSLGIDIHEEPRFSQSYEREILENTIMSVEPGLYLPKKYGVRIEDVVCVKKNGIINLTKSEKSMIILE